MMTAQVGCAFQPSLSSALPKLSPGVPCQHQAAQQLVQDVALPKPGRGMMPMSKALEADAYREGAGAAYNIKPTAKIAKLLMLTVVSKQAVPWSHLLDSLHGP